MADINIIKKFKEQNSEDINEMGQANSKKRESDSGRNCLPCSSA